MRTRSSTSKGFSLVEIMLALGVIAVALASVIGLLSVAFEASGSSEKDTVLVSMSAQVLDEMRSMPFDDLWLAAPSWMPRPSQVLAPPATSVTPPDWVCGFTQEGVLLPSTDGQLPAGSFYQCTVRKTPDPRSRAVTTEKFNRVALRLVFSWPVAPNDDPTKRPNQQTLNASISRY